MVFNNIKRNSKKVAVTLLIALTLITSMGVEVFAGDITPYGVNVSGYVAGTDYLSNMISCMNDGSKFALIVGSIFEKQRNLKIEMENLNYDKTNIFTSTDANTVRSNYNLLVQKTLAAKEAAQQQNNSQQKVSLGKYKLTFYCSCSKCCGKTDGITASGAIAKEGRTIAAPSNIPLGTKIYIEGWGTYIVEDRGGSINGNKIDIYVSSHSKALQCGVKYANVYIVK